MEANPLDKHGEVAKFQVDIMLEEYRVIRDLASKHVEWQTQLDAIALAALGATIPLIFFILESAPDAAGIILLIPVLFFAVMFAQLRHERLLENASFYIDGELRPKLERLLSQRTKEKISVLGYEGYLSRNSWAKNFFLEWLATLSHTVLSFASGIGVIALYIYLRLSQRVSTPWNNVEGWLFGLDGLILLVNLVIAYFVARKRFDYLSRRYYVRPIEKRSTASLKH